MRLIAKKYLLLTLCTFLASSLLISVLPLMSLAAGFTNSGFNNPFNDIPDREWRGQKEKIATGWNYFYVDANTYPGSGNASKLRFMSSAQFAAAFGGLDYKIEGDQSQSMWSSYKFDGGVYQQISGVTPGTTYGFDIAMVTYWRGPGYPDSDGIMVKQVGIDPYGGIDATSSNIVWSDTDSNDKAWVYMDVAATAQAGTVTIFAKVQAPENDSFNHTDLDMVYFDAAYADLAPTAAVIASNSGTTINANWSGNAAPGWSIDGYEVQYKDQAGGDWITLQNKNQQDTHKSFTGQAGHSYTVRVRPWQAKSESYNSHIDMPGIWVETNRTIGDAIIGQVQDHMGFGLNGVTVSAQGTATSTTSTNGGSYILSTGGAGTFNIKANDYDGLVAPPPISVTVTANGIANLDIMLRPTGAAQAIQNNDFETDLSHWNVSDGTAAAASAAAKRTGVGGLQITKSVEVSQTGTVSGMLNPLLSFWYKNSADTFTVELLGTPSLGSLQQQSIGPVTIKTLDPVSDWTHVTLDMGLTDVYTGDVGVNFKYAGGARVDIAVDEVSLAAGPKRIYLPVVFKN